MKVIVSHDVDHISLWEHLLKDSIIPKFYLRSYLEFIKSKITLKELRLRHCDLLTNKWNHVHEILEFNKSRDIKSTFFFGMSNALGLSYNYQNTKNLIHHVISNGFEVGVHGIAYNNLEDMNMERERFKQLSGLHDFGIRMHYLRNDFSTLDIMNTLGYSFDSTKSDFTNSYKFKNLTEFPIHLMDGWVMYKDKKYQNTSLQEAKERTKLIIAGAVKSNIDFFSFLFHDCYFSNRFQTWMDWYVWTIDYMKNQKFEFITYSKALEISNKI